MAQITEKDILSALSRVMDPELKKDLVSLNMIRDIHIQGGEVSFTLVLTTPACPLKNYLQKSAQEAVLALEGVSKVDINVTANVSGQHTRIDDKIVLPIKNSIAVSSGKGGVGKTTVAVNLAVSLAQSGAKVGLLDADIYGPNVPTMMGIDALPPVKDKKIIPAEAYGVKVISIGFLVKEGQPLIWRGPLLHSTIRQFLVDVNWGELDYLIIDLPPGTGDVQLSVAQNLTLTGGLVVTLPQKVSVEDASRGLEMFNKLNVPILGVIENMSYLELDDGTRMDIFGSGGGKALAQRAGVPFLGEIPLAPAIREGGDAGKPIVIAAPDSPAAKALDEITCSVAGKISQLVLQE
ncbi:MAG: Mrp/NBP35 family ATP-binding protein [Chloroflexi bacterium]|jgi:ATP-binding protein involved in chromosome partitioning|nr:Mrp/NBP35 family ATP-binding protein [Chloroflexota bacterium]